MGALAAPKMSVEEYIALDDAAELKSEYHDGELFPIDAMIAANATARLVLRLNPASCRSYISPVRVRVSPTKFVYPDILVVCGKTELTEESTDTITNPKVVVEILSPSTADYDYGGKFALYRRLPSFEEYVLIAQDQPRVEVFRKAADNRWILTTHEGLEAAVNVEALNITLPLAELYAGVEFPAPAI